MKSKLPISFTKDAFSLDSYRGQQIAAKVEGPWVGDQVNCALQLDTKQSSVLKDYSFQKMTIK